MDHWSFASFTVPSLDPLESDKTEKERLQRQFCEIGARVMCHVSGIGSLGGSFGGRLGRVGGRGRASACVTFGCFCVLRGLVHGSFVTLWGVLLFRRVLCPCVSVFLIVWLCVSVFVSLRVCVRVCVCVCLLCVCVCLVVINRDSSSSSTRNTVTVFVDQLR